MPDVDNTPQENTEQRQSQPGDSGLSQSMMDPGDSDRYQDMQRSNTDSVTQDPGAAAMLDPNRFGIDGAGPNAPGTGAGSDTGPNTTQPPGGQLGRGDGGAHEGSTDNLRGNPGPNDRQPSGGEPKGSDPRAGGERASQQNPNPAEHKLEGQETRPPAAPNPDTTLGGRRRR